MNRYLAKSETRTQKEETIQEHTDKLLFNMQLLRNLYPNIDINWQLLEVACKYHDLGKVNAKFQSKIKKRKRYDDEIAHNLLSLAFLDKNELRKYFTDNEIKILAQAIAYHHERGDYDAPNYKDEVELLKKEAVNFKYEKVKITKIKKIANKFFSNNRVYGNDNDFYDYVRIKGLLNRLDYAASGGINVEYENEFLNEGLENLNYNWNELQLFMKVNQNNNVIAVAQTGMGKTEAGLLWIGDNKGFFTLPLKTAINEIYKRITEKIVDSENKKFVGLLHSDTYSKYVENKSEEDDVDEYFNKTKQLSLPVTVCTLDQLFDIVFRFKGFEPKLVTLSYSKVVIDEVQMYSADLLAYLIIGLSYITKFGGKFAILTATLPGIVVDLLKKEQIKFMEHKPFINNNLIRHSLKVVKSSINTELIVDKYNDNKILVICNTIKEAQKIYYELTDNEVLKCKCKNINLFHSKFIRKDRKEKEKDIVSFGNLKCKESGIWIATQVVEASLDIDFDILFTELSDVNGLFQRLGRCYRKRSYDLNGYNCFVYDGGDNNCSGVGYFIDKKIFNFSKESIQGIDGRITEDKKLKIIDEVYSTNKLKDTDYYKDVLNNIDYVQSFSEYELSKKEVSKRFRNIVNITIMPSCVYSENKEYIDNLVSSILEEADKEKRSILRDKLNGFTVEVNTYEVAKMEPLKIKISKYQEILVYDGFEYNYEIGLIKTKNEDINEMDYENDNIC